jgi:hypothetical protein
MIHCRSLRYGLLAALLSLGGWAVVAQDKTDPPKAVGKEAEKKFAVPGKDDKAVDTEYMPLSLGTTWEYKIGEKVMTTKVAGAEKVKDRECIKLVSTIDKRQMSETVAVLESGVYRYAMEGIAVDPPVRFLNLPAKKDDKWDVKSTVEGAEFSGAFTTSEEKAVTTPAGKYDCLKVVGEFTVDGSKVTFTYWFAKGVGIVKQEIASGQMKTEVLLTKFTPAGK